MDLVSHQEYHNLARHLLPPSPPSLSLLLPLERMRAQHFCDAFTLALASMHSLCMDVWMDVCVSVCVYVCVCVCTDTWTCVQ